MNDSMTHPFQLQLQTSDARRRTVTAAAHLALVMLSLSSVSCGSDGGTSSNAMNVASANPEASSGAGTSTSATMNSQGTATGDSPTSTAPESGASSTQQASGNSSEGDPVEGDDTATGGNGGTGNRSNDGSSNVGGAGGQADDAFGDDDSSSEEPVEPATLDDDASGTNDDGAGGDGNEGFGGAPNMDDDDAGAPGAGGSGTTEDPSADDMSADDDTSGDDSSESADGCPGAGNVEYVFNDLGAWPADAVEKITPALEEALYYYNCYSDLSHSLTINYKPSVQTAEANVDGWISFGTDRNYMVTATVMHEIGHTMGVGFYPWAELMSDGRWTGSHVVELMAALPVSERDDDETSLRDYITADGQHFWPYGLNYASEHKSEWSLINHVRIVAAMNRDKDEFLAR